MRASAASTVRVSDRDADKYGGFDQSTVGVPVGVPKFEQWYPERQSGPRSMAFP
jgi:hypothetical protein